MAIINSYPSVTPKATDLLLISDVSVEGNPTRTVTINSVLALGTGSGGGITTIQSANTNYLSVTDPQGPVVTLDLNVGAVTSGGNSLATTGDIYSFTTTSITNAINNLGTIGTLTNFAVDSTAIAAFTTSVSNPTTTPLLTIGITGGSAGQYLDYLGNWSTPGGTGAMTSWVITGDNAVLSVVSDGNTVDIAGGSKISTVNIANTVTVNHDTTTTTPTTSSSSPGASGTFDAIDSITYDSTGHITGFNTNTVTLPAAGGGGGSGTVTSVGLDVTGISFLSSTPAFITSSGTFTVTASGTASEYVKGDGTLGNIADITGTYDWAIAADTGGETVTSGTEINFVGGTDMTTSYDSVAKELTIDYSGTVGVTSIDAGNTAFIDGATSTSPSPITSTGTLSYSLSATGTPNSSTFLRGDNSWATPPITRPPTYFSVNKAGNIVNSGNISDDTQGFGTITTALTAGGESIKITFGTAQSGTSYIINFTLEEEQVDTGQNYAPRGYVATANKSTGDFMITYVKPGSSTSLGDPVLTNFQLYK